MVWWLRDRQLGADDGAEAGGFGGLMKARRAVDAVAIEQRERGIAERRGTLDERFGQRRAAEKRKRRRGVELDVGHGRRPLCRTQGAGLREGTGHRASATEIMRPMPYALCPVCPSINHAFDEPLPHLALDEDAIDRAVGERDIPFVAIPTGRVRQVRRVRLVRRVRCGARVRQVRQVRQTIVPPLARRTPGTGGLDDRRRR